MGQNSGALRASSPHWPHQGSAERVKEGFMMKGDEDGNS